MQLADVQQLEAGEGARMQIASQLSCDVRWATEADPPSFTTYRSSDLLRELYSQHILYYNGERLDLSVGLSFPASPLRHSFALLLSPLPFFQN